MRDKIVLDDFVVGGATREDIEALPAIIIRLGQETDVTTRPTMLQGEARHLQ